MIATDVLDIHAYRLKAGDARRTAVPVAFQPLLLGGQEYRVEPAETEAQLELQASADGLYLKLEFTVDIVGPCYRCLEEARATVRVSAAEYNARRPDPDAEEELTCDYLDDQDQLDVEQWARDALVLELPRSLLCRPDCPGLCPRCGARLADDRDHRCGGEEVDERWAKLRELL